ncbi:hypothetical protein KAU33_01660, partial [Candidatus Dependentiae bacterium]|nr:hypothetical protein [Candidatus Dependentiae bacterium]
MRVKGTVFKSTIKFIKKHWGETGFQKILSNLTDEESTLLSLTVSNALWYPFEVYMNFSMAILKEFGSGDLSLLRRIGGYSALEGLKTGYKILFRMGSPFFIAKIAQKAYSMYFDVGKLELIEENHDEKYVILKLSEISEIHDFHLERISGWIEQTFVMTGG